MIDINEISALLHVEEKLRAHGNKYTNMLNAVRAKLDEHEATHTPKPEPKAEPVTEEIEEDEDGEAKPTRRL